LWRQDLKNLEKIVVALWPFTVLMYMSQRVSEEPEKQASRRARDGWMVLPYRELFFIGVSQTLCNRKGRCPMAKVGRPPAFDEAKRKKFCALISAGYDCMAASAAIGVRPATARREAARNPEFEAEWRDADLASVVRPLATLRDAASQNWRAASWCLERVYPGRYSKHNRKYVTLDAVNVMCEEFMAEISTAIPDRETKLNVFRRIRRLTGLWQRDWRPGYTLAKKERNTPRPEPDFYSSDMNQSVGSKCDDKPAPVTEPHSTSSDDATATPEIAPSTIPPNGKTDDVN
jgi:hypothetical protein